MKRSPETVGFIGEKPGRARPPAEWVERLRRLPLIERENLNAGKLFAYYSIQTNGSPIVARLIVMDRTMKLPNDIRRNGVYRKGNFIYYHRVLAKPEILEDLEAMHKTNRVRIVGYFAIPSLSADQL